MITTVNLHQGFRCSRPRAVPAILWLHAQTRPVRGVRRASPMTEPACLPQLSRAQQAESRSAIIGAGCPWRNPARRFEEPSVGKFRETAIRPVLFHYKTKR